MDEKGKMNTKEYEELIKEVKANSPYKRLSSAKKKWMSVSEMGELLGLKKTDRYWLVHKNFFETKEIAGKMRVNIESFEKWYANQIKYHKVNGEEPGAEPSDSGTCRKVRLCDCWKKCRLYSAGETSVPAFHLRGYGTQDGALQEACPGERTFYR